MVFSSHSLILYTQERGVHCGTMVWHALVRQHGHHCPLMRHGSALKRRICAVVDSSGYFWAKRPANEGDGTLLVGVTEAFMEDKVPGDVDKVTLCHNGVKESEATCMSFTICWSGLKMGEGDELYHSVWSNEEGAVTINIRDIPFVPKDVQFIQLNNAIAKDSSLFSENIHVLEVKGAGI